MTEQPDSSSAYDEENETPAGSDEAPSSGRELAPSAGDAQSSTGQAGSGTAEHGSGGRDVVVPLRLYKTITVFSTLIAIVSILAGFVLLDRATQRATASPEEVSLPLVALAIALIVAGSAVYALSTRFRTEGMGKSKDDTDRPSDNG